MPRVSFFLEVRDALTSCTSTRLLGDDTTLGDNGSLTFWDYNTGTPFQNMEDVPQPGSLEAEAGVFCSTFDMTGTRLITGGADKTIKVCYIFKGSVSASRLVRDPLLTIFRVGVCRTVAIALVAHPIHDRNEAHPLAMPVYFRMYRPSVTRLRTNVFCNLDGVGRRLIGGPSAYPL